MSYIKILIKSQDNMKSLYNAKLRLEMNFFSVII